MPEPIIINNLTKYYGKYQALDNLCLTVSGNKRVGLLGPNGAGKSTTLKIMCGLLYTSSGMVLIEGVNIAKNPTVALSKIGAIIETPEFYSYLTPYEVLGYFGRLRGMNGNKLQKQIDEIINLVNLNDWKKERIEKFSRGMKQRLALAQPLLHDPPILILDEPAPGLDPRGVVEFRKIIEEVGKQRTVFFAVDAIAGEFESHTGFMLFTNPVKHLTIIVGKYIASYISIAILIIFGYVIVGLSLLIIYGEVPFETVKSLGLALLFGGSVLSVTFFFSSISKGAMGATVITLVFIMVISGIIDAVLIMAKKPHWFMLSTNGDSVATVYGGYEVFMQGMNAPSAFMGSIENPNISLSVLSMTIYLVIGFIAGLWISNRRQLA
ncbi:MAG: ATP-binding cassette domain-containing protein [Dehalococcoidales bacterium]|nr:ATP-binding cassette domain-containing protein [Dehalococcoidales bacterium]